MKISKEIVRAIYSQAEREAPVEACGYLAGKGGLITKHYEMNNIDKSETHFSFDPKEQFRVVKEARNEGLELVAVYHSHPASPARPSAEDIELALDSSILYVIASLAGGKKSIKSFKIRKGEVIPEPLDVV